MTDRESQSSQERWTPKSSSQIHKSKKCEGNREKGIISAAYSTIIFQNRMKADKVVTVDLIDRIRDWRHICDEPDILAEKKRLQEEMVQRNSHTLKFGNAPKHV